MGECRSHWSAPVSPRENKYIHKSLFVHLRGSRAATIKSWSHATEIILAQMPEQKAITGNEEVGLAVR